ncbi:MAG: polysaccharide biosynthesis/export family protein [Chlamydiales bacterium]|nr:polysaccharide biosynthesis/export family protein [Chlamydiales bacterium]
MRQMSLNNNFKMYTEVITKFGLLRLLNKLKKSQYYLSSLLPLFFLLTLNSCASAHFDYPVMGADEFVMDSYRIRQGKLAILELEGVEVGELSDVDMMEYRDVIAEDDILNVAVYHPTRKDLMQSIQFINDTTGGFRVYQGRIDLPDLPSIEVKGLTLEEAKEVLQSAFREQIQDVEVYVNYRDRLQRKVELIGLVAIPTVPVDGKIRLYEVLARAHIPHGANLFKSYVMREGCQLPIDLHKLINEGDMCQNIVMRGGDKIFIAAPSDATVMVMGEVRAPRPINVPYGFISLREALVTAGGIPFTGNGNCIHVIRGNMLCPKVYVVSLDHVVHLPNDSLLLMPGDTVYVAEKPITQWNRFIEQLIPSFTGIQTGYGTYQLIND